MEVKFVNSEKELFDLIRSLLKSAAEPEEKKEEKKEPEITYETMTAVYAELNNLDFNEAAYILQMIPDYLGFQAMLRSAAVILDRQYPDHINEAEVDKYYTIDMSNGRVCEVPKGKVKNFRHFAAFRSLEDIKKATKALRPFIKHLWPNE